MLRSAVSSSTPRSFCRWAGCVWMKSSLTVGIAQVVDQAQVDAHPHAGEQVHRLFGADRLRRAENAVGPADAVVQVSWLSRTRNSRACRS